MLEVGCGEGLFLTELAEINPALEIWGIDNSAARLNAAQGRIRSKNLRTINLFLQDASRLSFGDEYFDVVVGINLICNLHPNSLIDVLKQMSRVCKKNGFIIFDFRNALNLLLKLKYMLAPFYDATVKNLPLVSYIPKKIETILKDLNLEVVEKKYIGFPLVTLAPVIILKVAKNGF